MTQAQWIESMESLSEFSPGFLNDVIHLLESLGYEIAESDYWLLGFCVQKVEQEIKNACNTLSIPEGLYQVAKGLIVAEFLSMKKANGEINGDSLIFEPMLKEIQEGDTRQTFAVDKTTSAEQRLDSFIARMMQGKKEFIRYRKIQW